MSNLTHDELLARLDELDHSCSVVGLTVSALRAVVELHKPVQHEEGTWCSGCSATEWHPCPTIQAIQSAIGERSETR